MKEITVSMTEVEYAAFAYVVGDPRTWVNNLVHMRAKQAIDQIVLEKSDRNPKKLSEQDRADIVDREALERRPVRP